MELRRCGDSKLRLSALGVGAWAFGGGDYWGEQDQKDVDRVVHRAVELGINYFDTAEVYNDSRSEASLANPLVTCVLVGCRNLIQLEANNAAVEEPLDQETLKRLNEITAPLKDKLGLSFDYYESPENDRTR